MFSSLASFLFGSNANCETNSDTTATETGISDQRDKSVNLEETDNFIRVTSLTPSVTGAGDRGKGAIKSGRNKHNNTRQQNKRKGNKVSLPLGTSQTNNRISDEEEFDEDDWFIVEKTGEDVSLTRANVSLTSVDSEEENVPVNELAKDTDSEGAVGGEQRHLLPSLYNRPRSQKQQNNSKKTRNHTKNKGLSVSTLSPSRTVNDGRICSGHEDAANGSITRSLFMTTALSPLSDEKMVIAMNGVEEFNKMEESWFITPPPCFTSVGPISMETSPYENLLIEHPSMSVYHSIKKDQDANKSFQNLDLDEDDMDEKPTANETTPKKNSQVVQARSQGANYRVDRQYKAELKQELMARNVQKVQNKKERSDICRTAIKRANKVRDIQSKNHTKRRSDYQHCRIFSNANNNRKTNCC